MPTTRRTLTVVIAARDAEAHIEECIRSAAWADEVLVVENDSQDATIECARAAGATVFSHPFTTIGGQRNAAIERASSEWILVVDHDERITPELRRAVEALLAAPISAAAYRVPRRNWFLGREIRHGGWEQDRPIRLFPRTLRYDAKRVHERVIVEGRISTVGAALLHYPYDSLDQYFAKQARYARDAARDLHARGRRVKAHTVVTRAVGRFVRMLVLKQGWRDGSHGVVLAALSAVGVVMRYARLWALQRGLDR